MIPNPLLKPTVLELQFNTLLPTTPELGDRRGTAKIRRDGSDIIGVRELYFRVILNQKYNMMRSKSLLPNHALRTCL